MTPQCRASCGLLWLALVCGGCDAPASSTATPTGAGQQAAAQGPATGEHVIAKSAGQNPDVNLSIVDFEGIQEHIARNLGKVVVMDAWSTSCPPCMKEFPHLVELHKKYGPQQVACMSLSFDYEGIGKPEEQQDRVLGFLRSQGATFDNLLSSEESDVLYRKLRLAAIPAVFIYSRDGKLAKRFDNEKARSKAEAFTYEQVGALVSELLKDQADGAQSPDKIAPADGNSADLTPAAD